MWGVKRSRQRSGLGVAVDRPSGQDILRSQWDLRVAAFSARAGCISAQRLRKVAWRDVFSAATSATAMPAVAGNIGLAKDYWPNVELLGRLQARDGLSGLADERKAGVDRSGASWGNDWSVIRVRRPDDW